MISRRVLRCIMWVVCMVGCMQASATHIFGGELLYHSLNDTQYVLSLTLYGDCSASIFGTLYTAAPEVNVSGGGRRFKSTLQALPGTGVEVSPICSTMKGNTSCNGGTLPGVKQFIYTDTIILSKAADWTFEFAGTMGKSSAGRSTNITNIQQPGTSGVYLLATLDNTRQPNSSPAYTTIPTPYYCLNTQQQYNQGAIDDDNDSLSFTLVTAVSDGSPVGYVAPYTPTHPMSASGFSFNNVNGQMTFVPDQLQDALVVNQVTEYRDGQIIGTSMREMTFIVIGNCENTPPVGALQINSIAGGTYAGDNIINVCKKSPQVSFILTGSDTDADSLSVSVKNLPSGATLDIEHDHTDTPALVFNWNTTNVPPGIYTFYVTYADDHCPIFSTQTIAYTINLVYPNTLHIAVIEPTRCVHQAYVQYALQYGTAQRTITISKDGQVIRTFNSSKDVITDSLPIGNYMATISSAGLDCGSVDSFMIVDSGTIITTPLQAFEYCQKEALKPVTLLTTPGATYEWTDTTGKILPGEPDFSTAQVGTNEWYLVQHYKTCATQQDTVRITVHELPDVDVQLSAVSRTICLGDIVTLPTVTGEQYVWTPADEVETAEDGTVHTLRILEPTTYTVIATNRYSCISNGSLTIGNIQPCCKVSYPDAFTPNNDGKNDLFHIVTYGNMQTFDLQVYNRWGQSIFSSTNQYAGWDGTYKGQPCEMGVYYYQLNAKCMTGQTEQHKGAITLIR